MVQRTVWAHLKVPMPDLAYEYGDLQEQGKGSKTWAAHSHTPVCERLFVGRTRSLRNGRFIPIRQPTSKLLNQTLVRPRGATNRRARHQRENLADYQARVQSGESPTLRRKRSINDASAEGDATDREAFASTVFMWDCELVDESENAEILSSKKDPCADQDAVRSFEKARRRRNGKRSGHLQSAIAENGRQQSHSVFYGLRAHPGVAMLCTGRESTEFRRDWS